MNPITDFLHFWGNDGKGPYFAGSHYVVWAIASAALFFGAVCAVIDLDKPKRVYGDYGGHWDVEPAERLRNYFLGALAFGLAWPVTVPSALAAGAIASSGIGIWRGASGVAALVLHIHRRRHD